MEHNDTGEEKLKFKDKLQIAWVIAVFVLIGILLFSVITLGKNIDVLQENPINYGIENSDISYCTCYNLYGEKYNFPEFKVNEGVSGGSG